MIVLVSYDLNKPGKDYEALYDTLRTADSWWHFLDSTWILSTSLSVESWGEKIRRVIDENDSVLVVDISKKKRDGWLSTDAWKWLRQHD